MFAIPPQTEADVASRRGRLFQLRRLAYGPQEGDEELDDRGRVILTTYQQIKDWLYMWATATHA